MEGALSRRFWLAAPLAVLQAKLMNKISYKGYRFPPDIVQREIWLYLGCEFVPKRDPGFGRALPIYLDNLLRAGDRICTDVILNRYDECCWVPFQCNFTIQLFSRTTGRRRLCGYKLRYTCCHAGPRSSTIQQANTY